MYVSASELMRRGEGRGRGSMCLLVTRQAGSIVEGVGREIASRRILAEWRCGRRAAGVE